MPTHRHNLGYLDLATPRKKQPLSNPKIQHSEVVLRKMIFLLEKTHGLMNRVENIYRNEKLSDKDKFKNSIESMRAVEKNIEEMKSAINNERWAIQQEFTRLRKLNPKVPLDQHPELKALKAASEKLAAFAETIKSTHALSMAPAAPKFDPTLASMPSVPSTKPVMTREQADAILKETEKSWNSGDRAMTRFAKDTKEKVTEIKGQIIDELFERRIEQALGAKPRDMSKEIIPPEAYGKPNLVDPLEKKYQEIFGEKSKDKLTHPDQDEDTSSDDDTPSPMHRR